MLLGLVIHGREAIASPQFVPAACLLLASGAVPWAAAVRHRGVAVVRPQCWDGRSLAEQVQRTQVKNWLAKVYAF